MRDIELCHQLHHVLECVERDSVLNELIDEHVMRTGTVPLTVGAEHLQPEQQHIAGLRGHVLVLCDTCQLCGDETDQQRTSHIRAT